MIIEPHTSTKWSRLQVCATSFKESIIPSMISFEYSAPSPHMLTVVVTVLDGWSCPFLYDWKWRSQIKYVILYEMKINWIKLIKSNSGAGSASQFQFQKYKLDRNI